MVKIVKVVQGKVWTYQYREYKIELKPTTGNFVGQQLTPQYSEYK